MAEETTQSTTPPVPASPAPAAKFNFLPVDDPTRVRAEQTASRMNFEHLLLKRYVEQTFEINKNLKVTLRSLSAGASAFVLRHLSKTYGQEWTEVFNQEARIHYTAAALQKVNDNLIGDDLDAAIGKSAEEATKVLNERSNYVRALPDTLITLFYAHFMLFSDRVDDFIKNGGEQLGNS